MNFTEKIYAFRNVSLSVPLLVNSLAMSCFSTNHPINMLVKNAPAGSINCAVRKSQKSISDIPNSCS